MDDLDRPLIVPAGATTPQRAPAGSEQRLFEQLGPHELWEQDDDEVRQAAARAKVERLRAADAAVAELEGAVSEVESSCPQPRNHALEVVVTDDSGSPLAGLAIELHRDDHGDDLGTRTNARGVARFEGLRAGDSHGLWIPSLPRAAWSTKGKEALPEELATVAYEASWGKTSTKTRRPAKHTVVDGECMWTLARTYGLDMDALWDANSTLGQDERSANVLAPGDVVQLPAPDSEPLEPAPLGQRITLECTLPTARACLRFQDLDGKARASLPAVVRVISHGGRETTWETTTDGDGCIDEPVPADAKTIDVVLDVEPEPQQYSFVFAYLDPITTVAGVQGRLANLGYHCGSERGELGPLTRRALREFQREHGLDETGQIDDPTRAKLEELY
ncbi:MAG: peptidoglycan-binding protein [Nannocystaceae bacterium]